MKFTENNEFIIDGNKTIPCDEANRDFHIIKHGDDSQGIVPILDDVLPFEPPVVNPQIQINTDALAYLAATDWYVVRLAETGTIIPPNISAARQTAREAIV